VQGRGALSPRYVYDRGNAGTDCAGAAFAVDADSPGQDLRSCGILLVVPGIFRNIQQGILLPCGIVPLAMREKNGAVIARSHRLRSRVLKKRDLLGSADGLNTEFVTGQVQDLVRPRAAFLAQGNVLLGAGLPIQ
jgi:hypothetical protein